MRLYALGRCRLAEDSGFVSTTNVCESRNAYYPDVGNEEVGFKNDGQ